MFLNLRNFAGLGILVKTRSIGNLRNKDFENTYVIHQLSERTRRIAEPPLRADSTQMSVLADSTASARRG